MYQTYKTEELNTPVEEKLIPKEKTIEKPKESRNHIKNNHRIFGNLENEDILILGLLLVLFFEDCKDNMLIIVLVALLFIKD